MRALNEDLSRALDRFVGRHCTGYMAGGAAGSHVTLEFEPRTKRINPLKNPAVSEEQRLTEAEYVIFIQCSWRLDSESEVVCGSWDDNSANGPMLKGLNRLAGRELDSFNLTSPGLDLELRFADLSLRIFCDNVNAVDMTDNYSLFLPGEIITVATRSRVEREERSASTSGKEVKRKSVP